MDRGSAARIFVPATPYLRLRLPYVERVLLLQKTATGDAVLWPFLGGGSFLREELPLYCWTTTLPIQGTPGTVFRTTVCSRCARPDPRLDRALAEDRWQPRVPRLPLSTPSSLLLISQIANPQKTWAHGEKSP